MGIWPRPKKRFAGNFSARILGGPRRGIRSGTLEEDGQRRSIALGRKLSCERAGRCTAIRISDKRAAAIRDAEAGESSPESRDLSRVSRSVPLSHQECSRSLDFDVAGIQQLLRLCALTRTMEDGRDGGSQLWLYRHGCLEPSYDVLGGRLFRGGRLGVRKGT